MSRGVKDLRELINVSRLTHRPDYEPPLSPESEQSDAGDSVEASRLSSASSNAHPSSDSGMGGSPHEPNDVCELPASVSISRRRSKRRLPPLRTAPDSSKIVPLEEERPKRNFDVMMECIDSACVTDWLERATTFAHELNIWCNDGVNFCAFADFWLSSFPDSKKREIVELEVSVLNDELAFALREGYRSKKITRDDVQALIQALLHEYPVRLLGPESNYFFLSYLDVLSSERSSDYRALLTDVRLSTRNRLYAQWFLSIRSFALLNIWSAVVGFFRELTTRGSVRQVRPKTANIRDLPTDDHTSQRLIQAVSHSFLNVIDYYIQSKKIKISEFRDDKGRNLIFLAVSVQQHDALSHLVTKYRKHLDINCPSDTGNTPLHAAVSAGDLDLVRILVEANADLNPVNPQSDGSSPLHLAVLYGNSAIAAFLLEKGADPGLKSNGLSASMMAKEFGHTYIHELIARLSRCDL